MSEAKSGTPDNRRLLHSAALHAGYGSGAALRAASLTLDPGSRDAAARHAVRDDDGELH
jgi:hypothetical protein